MTPDVSSWSKLLNLSAQSCLHLGRGILRWELVANRIGDICRVPCCPMLGNTCSYETHFQRLRAMAILIISVLAFPLLG